MTRVHQNLHIHDLFMLFRDALIAVAPIADRAGINWMQEPPYDDWDEPCSGLFYGFILSAVGNSDLKLGSCPPNYGFEPDSEKTLRYFCRDVSPGEAFVSFCTGDPQFSSLWMIDVATKQKSRVNWADCRMALHVQTGGLVHSIEVSS